MNTISRKILCVDDDLHLLEALRRQLRRDFDVSVAPSAQAGMEAMAQNGPFAVVLSDYSMPEVNGVEFLRQVRALAPDTVTIMLTGNLDLDIAIAALHEGQIFRFLSKPVPPDALRKALAAGIEQYRLVQTERLLTEQLALVNADLSNMNATLEQKVIERTAALFGMHTFLMTLHRHDGFDAVANAIVEGAAKLLSASRAALFLPERDDWHVHLAACWPQDGRIAMRDARMPIEGTATGRAFIETDPHFWTGRDGNPPLHRIEALVFGEAPHVNQGLAVANRPVGVLAVAGPEDTPELRSTLRAIAEVAAIAVGNQLRRQQRDEVRDSLIFALARLAESRDPETGTHLERVQIYCRLLAERMRASSAFLGIIDNDFVENLFRSAPLHDIGKVGVPDRILRKPGKLTAEEFELMKQHAKIGGDTLHAVMRQGRTHAFLQMGMEIAYCHHERFDGSGYPQGLKGESIPLAARILALADVYDALTTQRVYKAAMGHAEARELIIKERGRHFDPAVVDAFLEGLEDFDRTRQALADVVGETAERTHTPTMTGPAPRGPVPETPRE